MKFVRLVRSSFDFAHHCKPISRDGGNLRGPLNYGQSSESLKLNIILRRSATVAASPLNPKMPQPFAPRVQGPNHSCQQEDPDP
eukprot:5171211-Amphidinium_carterae.1